MKNEKKIAIIAPYSLLGYGLKQVLTEYFDQNNAHIFAGITEFMNADPDSFDFFFLQPESLLSQYDFFIPRKSRTILLANNSDKFDAFTHLSLKEDISATVDRLQMIFEQIMKDKEEGQHEELSLREKDVLRLIARGYMNKQIADELCISLNTVLTHRKNITSKLGIKTVSGLTFYAMMNGLN